MARSSVTVVVMPTPSGHQRINDSGHQPQVTASIPGTGAYDCGIHRPSLPSPARCRSASRPLRPFPSRSVPRADRQPAEQQPWGADEVALRPSGDEAVTLPQVLAVECTLTTGVPAVEGRQIGGGEPGKMPDGNRRVVDHRDPATHRPVCPVVVLTGSQQRPVLLERPTRSTSRTGNAMFGGNRTSASISGVSYTAGSSATLTVRTIPSAAGPLGPSPLRRRPQAAVP